MDFSSLEGKKSYFVAVLAAVYALAGAAAGYHSWTYALTILMGAGGLGAIAAKINRFVLDLKIQKEVSPLNP